MNDLYISFSYHIYEDGIFKTYGDGIASQVYGTDWTTVKESLREKIIEDLYGPDYSGNKIVHILEFNPLPNLN